MQQIGKLVKQALNQTAAGMAAQANKHQCNHAIEEGQLAWLSLKHVILAPGLGRKLVDKFVGPIRVLERAGEVRFKCALPEHWKICNVFHVSQLKPAFGISATQLPAKCFRPPADGSGEFDVKDLLDHRIQGRGKASTWEYLVKQKGYSMFEVTWEPTTNLTNCDRVIAGYRDHRGLR